MIELILFYKFSFFVAGLSSGTLAIMGKHLLARGYILNIFLLSQFALLGNMISQIIFHDEHNHFMSLFSSLIFFFAGSYFLEKIKMNSHLKSPVVISGYLLLLSIQYLFISIFPQLDSHVSLGVFGNMVTATFADNIIMTLTYLSFVIIYMYIRRSVNKQTFEVSVLETATKNSAQFFVFSIPLVVSLFGLGFLYTLSFLLIPYVVLGRSFRSGKVASQVICSLAIFSSILGLLLSITFERVSTTPAQVICLFLIASLLGFLRKNGSQKSQ